MEDPFEYEEGEETKSDEVSLEVLDEFQAEIEERLKQKG